MLSRSGVVGHDLLDVDWSATPLGPPETWPGSLQTVIRILLTSRFSMWMAWGPELTFFCNEAYRRDTLGKKYPWALGKPASEVWSEIWPDIGPRIETVMSTGVATWDESLLLFLERSGYVEESYHTFSYSPLADDGGSIVGMLCVVKEDTEQVIAARRMQTLRDLGSRTKANPSQAETIASACQVLAQNDRSLPFTLTYLYDDDGSTARLAGQTGFSGAHPAAPASFSVDDADPVWPSKALGDGDSALVGDLASRFDDLPHGGWDVPPTEALVVPLASGTQTPPYGFFVAGLNPFRPANQEYRGFVDLVAGQLAAGITDARSYEIERERAESLAALDQAKTDFFTNVSHEFRTPLTLMLGPAEDALTDRTDPLPGRQRERVEVVMRNGQRLLKLVNTLLDFSRLESGKIQAGYEPVDLSQYTRELASMFDSAARRAGLTLTVDCPPLPEDVFVDRELWAKVVLNLLSNALKFTFEGGITVALAARAGHVELTVTDTGTGIPAAELPQLFERFHRVSGARSRTHEGSGIGLALVDELARLHGGTVRVASEPDSGTTFTVQVPFGSAHLPADQVSTSAERHVDVRAAVQGFLAEASRWSADQPEAAGPADDDGSPRPRVLVVDDNPDIREYVARLLADDYAVALAVDGVDGLDQVRSTAPDLVLTDVMMPRLDGFGLLAALQGDPATSGIPVVMLSARAGEDGMVEGLEAGADDYLVKPFTARELRARVRANLELDRARRTRQALERSQEALDRAQRLARVGSWEVDLASGGLQVSDELLRMSGRSREEFTGIGYPGVISAFLHPDDVARVEEQMAQGVEGADLQYEARLVRPDGETVLVLVHGEAVPGLDGEPERLRGSVQDITEQKAAERALAAAAANAVAAAREHEIADQLQRSLLPQQGFDLDHLDVATYYRAGVEGTQVGGDWYDVIELGAGRTALVVGDVMGRGVQAAAVMGQLRAAVRAYARLDLPPADVLEFLDGIVREFGQDQIVTCVYAVFDPAGQTLSFANAGHLPPLVVGPDGLARRLTGAEDPPLGAGPWVITQQQVSLHRDETVLLYTDGLVERRGDDLDDGIDALARIVSGATGATEDVADLPERVVRELLPSGPEDDVAILVARVDAPRESVVATARYEAGDTAGVMAARTLVSERLTEKALPRDIVGDAVLITSELVTNALLHGTPPVDLRLRTDGREVMLEVADRATFRPRKLRPGIDDEHGRGMQIVAALSSRWGTRATEEGKSVWCLLLAPGQPPS